MPAPVPVKAFLEALLSLREIDYIFGAKDPLKDGGLDCSGAVTYALKLAGGPDLRQTHNAARIYCEVEHEEPNGNVNGCLAFYGPPGGPSTHVMTLVTPEVFVGNTFAAFGATGGNSLTLTPEIAKRIGARVQYRAKVNYRPDLMKTGRWIRLDYK